MYKYEKKINNNVVLAIDSKNTEWILFGLGIGFSKPSDNYIDPRKIEKKFKMTQDSDQNKVISAITNINADVLSPVIQIINDAEKYLKKQFDDNEYISLLAYIYEILEGKEGGVYVSGVSQWEITSLYKLEYHAAEKTAEYLEKTFNVSVSENQKIIISYYFIDMNSNNELKEKRRDADRLIEEVDKILDDEMEKLSVGTSFFVTALHSFLRYKVLQNDSMTLDNVKGVTYNDAVAIVINRINNLLNSYEIELNRDELSYLEVLLINISKDCNY